MLSLPAKATTNFWLILPCAKRRFSFYPVSYTHLEEQQKNRQALEQAKEELTALDPQLAAATQKVTELRAKAPEIDKWNTQAAAIAMQLPQYEQLEHLQQQQTNMAIRLEQQKKDAVTVREHVILLQQGLERDKAELQELLLIHS